MKRDVYEAGSDRSRSRKVRYAVVGLGHIAQNAILPSFAHAAENSELAALVSDDPEKLLAMQKEYSVDHTFDYKDYDVLLRSGEIDAVYIALPNNLHRDYSVRAAKAGIHVLCEKPLAPTEEDCRKIMQTCSTAGVKLMTAYRLHFEKGNLEAIELVRSGEIGDPRIFNSVFTQQVASGNIRVNNKYANGTLYDVGVYCINAARYIFRAEPTEASCSVASADDPRFVSVEEMASCVLRFPDERLAAFTTSFGAASAASYEVVGTRGKIRVSPAYDYSQPVVIEITKDGKTRNKTFPVRDQFAPELIHFSNCILKDKEPEPSGQEGLADVKVIRALYQSAKQGRVVRIGATVRRKRPSMKQEIHRPAVPKPRLIRVKAPTR
jgi:predicted dehydrogenase